MKAILAGLAGLCIAMTGATAFAQTSHGSPHQAGPRIIDRIARQHFDLGNEYFQVARYDDAAREFQRAYEITHQTEILYNIARAREGAGDISGALQTYEQFDQAGAPGIDRDLLHERMENLRARTQASTTPTTTSSASPEPASAAPASTAPTTPVASGAPVATAPPVEQHYTYRRSALSQYGPFVVIGLGVVAGAIAAWQAVAAENDYARVSNLSMGMGTWDANATSSYNNAPVEGTLAWVLGGVGAACIVGGVVWLVARGPGERVPMTSTRVMVAPLAHGNGAWVGIGGAL